MPIFDEVLQNIKSDVDRIQTFPEDIEDPQVARAVVRREVLTIALYGSVEEMALRAQADLIREELLNEPGITQIDLMGAKAYEISIEISEPTLRKYKLTLAGVADRIQRNFSGSPCGLAQNRVWRNPAANR